MNRLDVAVWAALLGIGIAFEVKEIREGDVGVTLSRLLRCTFRTEHPVGAAVFEAAVLAGSHALVRHIVKEVAR